MKTVPTQWFFPPFRLDLANAQLWRDKEEVTLRPKTFEVLRHLVDNPGKLVTKATLLDAVWGEVSVSDTMPANCIAELRKALGDQARTPRFIETVHRRGYRFIAKVTTGDTGETKPEHPNLRKGTEQPLMVGREEELGKLLGWFSGVLEGRRRVIFIAGEPGIGKTTFVQAFLDLVGRQRGARTARGQCVEQYGSGEPYMPVLEALSKLSREAGGDQVVEVLNRFAPTLLAQMPELLTREERIRLQGETQGVTQQRMLREMAIALEALTAETPLVLLLEDLQWSDFSTLELISAIARRSEAARLWLIGTYRPVEMLANDHPLRRMKPELELHRYCEELRLRLLTQADVASYLARRFSDKSAHQLERFAPAIHARTDGNPLFMVNVVDYLVEEGRLADSRDLNAAATLTIDRLDAPRSIRQMIERNLERLQPEEQAVLEGASVAGSEFSAAAVAAALDRPQNEIEACCTRLSRHEQFVSIQDPVTWPDGTVAASFRFHHALYQEVLYGRLPAGHQLQLHRRIALREEAGYGERAGEVATELAYHYSRANDRNKAIEYLRLAGERAAARGATVEAIAHLNRGLELIETLPEMPERWERELAAQTTLGPVLIAAKGYAAPEVRDTYARADTLCQQLGDSSQLSLVLFGLFAFSIVRAEHEKALGLAEHLLRVAERANDEALLLQAHNALGMTYFFRGDFAAANEHLAQCLALYDPQHHNTLAFSYAGQDPRVTAYVFSAWASQASGYADQALKRIHDALSSAQGLSHPYSLSFARGVAAGIQQLRKDAQLTQDLAQASLELATEHGFPFWSAFQDILLGWVLVKRGRADEAITQMSRGMEAYWATGAELLRPYFNGLLAEALAEKGSVERGLALLNKALEIVDKTGERFYEAELYRRKGELLIRSDPELPDSPDVTPESSRWAAIEECFLKAISIARQQGAKWFELRSSTNLARLWERYGRIGEAHSILAETYDWFTEGFDTLDLREARALLDRLSGNLRLKK
jgi:DNA-binding winged helix-turn-helix (wHTH) protein/predicted ATPase